MGESWSELFKRWGWGLPKAHCPVHGEAVGVFHRPADWQRKGGVSFGGILLLCSNPREISGHKVREEETEKRRWLTGHIKRVDWPRLGQTNLLKMRAATGHCVTQGNPLPQFELRFHVMWAWGKVTSKCSETFSPSTLCRIPISFVIQTVFLIIF